MSFLDIFRKPKEDFEEFIPPENTPVFTIVECDCCPDEFSKQIPIKFIIEKTIPGSDRPDYTVARCLKPLKCSKQRVNYLVVGARLVGERLSEETEKMCINIAYVLDESLLDDETMVFDKCRPAAIGTAVRQ